MRHLPSGRGGIDEPGPMQILPGRHAGFAVLELFGSEGPGPGTAWGIAQRLAAAEVDALRGGVPTRRVIEEMSAWLLRPSIRCIRGVHDELQVEIRDGSMGVFSLASASD